MNGSEAAGDVVLIQTSLLFANAGWLESQQHDLGPVHMEGGGLKHSPPLHASHLGEIVSRAAANHKQDGGQQKRFGGKLLFFYHSFR